MKIGDGLPLDEHAVSKVVVTGAEPSPLDVHADCRQLVGNAAGVLEPVGDDSAHWRSTLQVLQA